MGNLKLQWLVEESLEHYLAQTEKQAKSDIIDETVEQVKASGGRFLTKESGVWSAVSDDLAHIKVSHLYRNRRIREEKKQNGGKSSGSMASRQSRAVPPSGTTDQGGPTKRLRA